LKYGDVIHNTEDKNWWLKHGEVGEKDFVNVICPKIGLDGCINPNKNVDPTVPDLIVNGKLADLKSQNTPFFTAGKYCKKVGGADVPFNPTYTVTFNKKDYERYSTLYPEIDIYFWVEWKEREYTSRNGKVINVSPLAGVWFSSFERLSELIKVYEYPLHSYLRRKGDIAGNAKESYLLDLKDLEEIVVFENL
jgi:hypothetical protein